ncbi:elongin B-like protein [Aphelenchoides avenae]|nr:elongin B-like protein [Aphelenchus avenae]
MDLYFEVLRKKTHILCEARETSTVSELKKIIEGILKVSPKEQTLKRPVDEARSEWQALDDKKLLSDLGYNNKNAKADEPAVLALVLREDCDNVIIDPVSTPPPLPDAMRQRDSEFQQDA